MTYSSILIHDPDYKKQAQHQSMGSVTCVLHFIIFFGGGVCWAYCLWTEIGKEQSRFHLSTKT